MPGKPDRPHRIRVRVLDGKPRDAGDFNKLKSNQLGMPHLDIHGAGAEAIICAQVEKHLVQVRTKLGHAGLEEIPGGDTTIPASAVPTATAKHTARRTGSKRQEVPPERRAQPRQQGGSTTAQLLPLKPYGFVALPETLTTASPVWHDGTSSQSRYAGEVRFELETLTPLLVGWERGQVGDGESDWPLPTTVGNIGQLADKKSVLCPLRAPWGKRAVIIPGDSLKGLLRHELGALLGAPMERVAERSYSYRPNSMYPDSQHGRRLVPRLARVPVNGTAMKPLAAPDGHQVRVPTRLELLPPNLEYNKRRQHFDFTFDQTDGNRYCGGLGAGERLNSKRKLHHSLTVRGEMRTDSTEVPEYVQDGYIATLRHLTNPDHGHFTERHPDVPKVVTGSDARMRILEAAKSIVFEPGDLIWVEWDTDEERIVSLGWHYYYRWAYMDSVRVRHAGTRPGKGGGYERHGLFPLEEERACDSTGAPAALSAIRRLFGYTGDNEGSAGIGTGDHEQLMGRVSLNAGIEVVGDADTEETRFLPPTFLKELGMPRPGAVEHYLQQPHNPRSRPSDRATLVTYGDAVGYDLPGDLAGRKFYLDRRDAYTGEPWKDDSQINRANDRSTLAVEASRAGRRFRFTLRFRDLDASELAAILVALSPHQFRAVLTGEHPDGYCSKLGYARPLGWGSVRIEAKALLWLEVTSGGPTLEPEPDLIAWVKQHHRATAMQDRWLDVHRHKHPDAADYPRARDRDGNENIYTFHTKLRADHSRDRRYRNRAEP